MWKITAIRGGKRPGKRVNIYIDGRFTLALDAEIAIREGLRLDTELETDRVEELVRQDQNHRCREAALRYLDYRPRSESELRKRLRGRGFAMEIIDSVIKGLKEQGLVDDNTFARFWTENRESFSPRSQYLTRRELRQKGVAEDVINRVISTIDDEDSAYRTALHRVRRMAVTDYQALRRRLSDYLRRRGFSYDVINHTIEKIWQESGRTKSPQDLNL